jgi:hypothetical protein
MANQESYSPFFPGQDKGVNYTVAGQKPQTTNTTFYNSKDLYETISLAEDRAYNIGCSGYRMVLVSGQGVYKYAPCTNSQDYKKLMKEMPNIPVERRYYDFDPTDNIYDIRDSFNDVLPDGFDYKRQVLRRTLSNVIYRDPIKEGILNYFERVFFGLIESTKQIKNFFNYTVKKNNRRVF